MNDVLILLLIAGLVVGVGFVSGVISFHQAPPEGTKSSISDQDNNLVKEETLEKSSKPEQPKSEQLPEVEEHATALSEVESLDFKVDYLEGQTTGTTRFRIRNPETENEDLRIDSVRKDGSEMTIILRQSTNEGWIKDYASNEVTHVTGIAFMHMWGVQSDNYLNYKVTDWKEMEGQSFTVEKGNSKSKIYDIRVNNGIPDSVFSPSSI